MGFDAQGLIDSADKINMTIHAFSLLAMFAVFLFAARVFVQF